MLAGRRARVGLEKAAAIERHAARVRFGWDRAQTLLADVEKARRHGGEPREHARSRGPVGDQVRDDEEIWPAVLGSSAFMSA